MTSYAAALSLVALVACGSPDAANPDAGADVDAGALADAAPPTDASSGPLWAPLTSGVSSLLYAVWGTAADDLFVVGDGGTILHFDGVQFQAEAGGAGATLFVVTGDGAGHVWAAGQVGQTTQTVLLARATNGAWQPVPGTPAVGPIHDIAVVSPTELYIAAVDVWHVKDGVWTATHATFPTTALSIAIIPGTSPRQLVAGGQNLLGHHLVIGQVQSDGSVGWSNQALPVGGPALGPITTVLAFGPADIYASAWQGNVHREALGWFAIPLGRTGILRLWGHAGEVFGVGGSGTIVHRTTAGASVEPSGTSAYLAGVWGDGAGTVFAVGASGTVLRRR